MELQDHTIKTGSQLIGGLIGAIIPVALADKITIGKAVVLTIVGLAVSYYIAPLICYAGGWQDNDVRSAVGFLVGLTGVQVAHAIINHVTAARLQAFFTFFVDKKLWGKKE